MIMNNRISVIIPVLHESEIINDVIDHIRSVEDENRVEIILVEGSPERDTVAALKRNDVRTITSPRGRGIQMNRGARVAKGCIFVFLHADTRLPPDAFRSIRDALSDDRVVAGAFTLEIDEAPFLIRMGVPINNLRSRLTRIPYGDQVIFIRGNIFLELGGYMDQSIMEDIELMRRIKRRGCRIAILKDRASTSGRRFLENGPARTVITNIILIVLFHLGVDPERLARAYYGKLHR